MEELPGNLRALRNTLYGLIALALMLIGFLVYRNFSDVGSPAVEPRAITARGDLATDEKATIALFKQTTPSVVFITRLGTRYDLRMQPVNIPEGTGSGFIWDDGGDIVTNYHVIRGASGAKITLSNRETYDADLVGFAPEFDLAVLRIQAPKSKLTPILIGSSSDIQVGQKVFAIGNPFGLDHTLTTGIVSAIARTIQGVAGNPIEDVIQTDAAINPGNSGGPLLDSAGRLVGVNTAVYSQSGSSAGIGFAVPVDTVNRIVPQLVANGKVVKPQLGVTPLNDRMNAEVAIRTKIPGLVVLNVVPGSPAERAGIRGTQRGEDGRVVLGDLILNIDDRPVRNAAELFTALNRYTVGDKITVTVFRDGQQVKVPVTLSALSQSTQP